MANNRGDSPSRGINRRAALKLILVAAGAASGGLVSACSSAPANPPAPPAAPPIQATTVAAQAAPAAPTGQRVTLRFLSRGSTGAYSEQDLFKRLVDGFNASQKDIFVSFEPWPGGGWDKVMAMFTAGTAADLMRLDDDDFYFIASKEMLHDLTPYYTKYIDKNQYYEDNLTLMRVNGKNFGVIPCLASVTVLYNKKLFSAAGIKPFEGEWKDAWSWDTFLENATRLSKKEGGKPSQYAWGSSMAQLSVLPYANEGSWYNADETKATLDTPQVVEVLRDYAALTHKHNYVPYPEEDPRPLFYSGKLAMLRDSMTVLPDVPKDMDWDVMPLPKMKKHPYALNWIRIFGIPKTSKYPEEGFQFYRYIMAEEGQKRIAEWDWGVPALKSVAQSAAFTNPGRSPAARQLFVQAIDQNPHLPENPMGPVANDVLKKGALPKSLLNGTLPAEEFVKRANEKLDAEIKKIGWKKAAA